MKGIFEFIEKYFFIVILVAVVISLVYPNSFKWVLSEYGGINIINLLLSIVLFTMGTTLKVYDFCGKVELSSSKICFVISDKFDEIRQKSKCLT